MGYQGRYHGMAGETLWDGRGDTIGWQGRHHGMARETPWDDRGDTMGWQGRHHGMTGKTSCHILSCIVTTEEACTIKY